MQQYSHVVTSRADRSLDSSGARHKAPVEAVGLSYLNLGSLLSRWQLYSISICVSCLSQCSQFLTRRL